MTKLLGIFVLFILFSCEKELLIPVPHSKPKLVVESYLRKFAFNSNNKMSFHLRSSSNVNDTVTYGIISDAMVLLYKNNVLFDTLEIDSSNTFYTYDFTIANSPKPNDEFKIEVIHPDFPLTAATTTMPSSITLLDTVLTPVYSLSSTSSNRCKVDIIFQDPPEENYYEIIVTDLSMIEDKIAVFSTFPSIINQPHYPKPYDLLNGNQPNSLLFTDTDFNGKQVSIDVIYSLFGEIVDDYFAQKVVLRHITKEQYVFKSSVLQHIKSKQSDILYGVREPLVVPSFVKNGYGIFAAHNETIIDVVMKL